MTQRQLGPLPRWLVLWLALSSVVVVWDALFVLLRPHSMTGGSLAFVWPVYDLYLAVDHSYADLENTTVAAICTMSLLECIGVGIALAQHARGAHPAAHLLALICLCLTGAKTVLFFLIEVWSGLEGIGHAEPVSLLFAYILPNTLWVVVPLAGALTLSRRLTRHLA